MTGPQRSDPFSKVVGVGRGLSDPALLGTALDDCKQALAEAGAALRVQSEIREAIELELARTEAKLNDAEIRCRNAMELANQAEMREYELCDERDRARYAAMRCGLRDPAPNKTWERAHQGVWTPGRPYLSYQHVWHPKTSDCYRTDKGGAPAGELPGTGRHWQPCIEPRDTCPTPVQIPADTLDHPLDGTALRQTDLWWNQHHTALNFRDAGEVSDEYLENILDYLRRHAKRMCSKEGEWDEPFVPCPWLAYASPRAWLNDTPLMRALMRERRRRRAARRREANKQEAAP